MTLDLLILALAFLVGVLGARRGAASQLAGWGALVLAVLAARPGAQRFGPAFQHWLQAAPGVARVAAGFATFVVVLVAARLLLQTLLRGVLTLGNPERRGLDRTAGFVLGAAKVLAIAWVALSALAFVEERFRLTGKVLGADPSQSLAFSAARRWNLFGMANLGAMQSLLRLEQVLRQPGGLARLQREPAMAELLKNPRFRALSEDPVVKRAVEQHDLLSLLHSDSVSALLQDSEATHALQVAADATAPSVSGATK